LHWTSFETSARGNDQFRIVTGPVNMPFIGRLVSDLT
jgi:hypothetical protein